MGVIHSLVELPGQGRFKAESVENIKSGREARFQIIRCFVLVRAFAQSILSTERRDE